MGPAHPANPRLSRRVGRWGCIAAVAVLLIPAANYQTFSGLPLNTPIEYAALAFLAPLVAWSALARLFRRFLCRLHPHAALGFISLIAAVAVLKLLVFASGDYRGLPGCYRFAEGERWQSSPCERSYDNPFRRVQATRIDPALDFDPNEWNLSFINSTRFNFYPRERGNIRRDRMPIAANWSGWVDLPPGTSFLVEYTGEGTVIGAGRSVTLLPAYGESAAHVEIPLPSGGQRILVNYVYNDHSRTGARTSALYATLHLRVRAADGRELSLARVAGARVSRFWRPVAVLADCAFAVALAFCAAFYLVLLAVDMSWIVSGAAIVIGLALLARHLGLAAASVAGPSVPALLLWTLLVQRRPRRLVAAWFLMLAAGVVVCAGWYPSFRAVLLRPAGEDWLTYQSQAYAILAQWSLLGDEPVFYYQPLFRYVVFLGHLLFGDGDMLAAVTAYALIAASITVMHLNLVRWASPLSRLCSAIAGGLMFGIVLSATSVEYLLVGASEYATWFLVPAAVALLLPRRAAYRRAIGGALMLAASAITRVNQLPGALMLLVASLGARLTFRRTAAIVLSFAVVLALPLAHNRYYGHRAVLFTTSGDMAVNRPITLRQLVSAAHDPAARAVVLPHLQLVVAAFPLRPVKWDTALEWTTWWLSIHALQLAWLGMIVYVLATHRLSLTTAAVLASPAAYLGVHVLYQVAVYYPRHIIMGHLAMGIAVSYAGATIDAPHAGTAGDPVQP